MNDDQHHDELEQETPGPSDDARRVAAEDFEEHRRYTDEERRDRLSDYGGLDGIPRRKP